MSKRICSRFGVVAGGSTGMVINMLASPACCGTASLSTGQTIVYGMLAALAAAIPAAAIACIVSRRPTWALLTIAILIAIFAGGLLGPLAYALSNPMLSLFVCGVLGGLLGIILCWILCLEQFGSVILGARP